MIAEFSLEWDLGFAVQVIAIFEAVVCIWALIVFAIDFFKHIGFRQEGIEEIFNTTNTIIMTATLWTIMNLQLFRTIGNGKDQLFISILWAFFHLIFIFMLLMSRLFRPLIADTFPFLVTFPFLAYLFGATSTVGVYIVRDLL